MLNHNEKHRTKPSEDCDIGKHLLSGTVHYVATFCSAGFCVWALNLEIRTGKQQTHVDRFTIPVIFLIPEKVKSLSPSYMGSTEAGSLKVIVKMKEFILLRCSLSKYLEKIFFFKMHDS